MQCETHSVRAGGGGGVEEGKPGGARNPKKEMDNQKNRFVEGANKNGISIGWAR